MAAELSPHPPADTLRAFGQGTLDGATARTVWDHVAGCPDCRQAVVSLSGLSAGPRDAAPAAAPPELADHPQYRVIRELGRGGMGVVYLAHNVLMDRPEVLKVLGKALLDEPGARDRFLREVRAAAKLDHPHVVKAHSALPLGETLALAMEYVEGEDLAKVVQRQGPLPVAHACLYIRQVALGLQHAHEQGMVHRDIKPHNLILTRQGNTPIVKVLDFGLAKATRAGQTATDLTGTGQMMGTPEYVAPEQALDAARADIRADVYGLGCTLYYLLNGAPPFAGRSTFEVLQAQVSAQPRPLDEVRPDVPAGLAAVVAKMLAKEPARRYQSPAEVARALEPFVQGGMLPLGRPAAQARRGKKARRPAVGAPAPGRKRWTTACGGLGLACLLLLALTGVMALWVNGVLRPPAAGSTLVIVSDEPRPDVYVDGESVAVTWAPDGQTAEVPVNSGAHRVEVKKGGFTAFGEAVDLRDGERRVLRARLLAQGPPAPPPKQEVQPPPAPTIPEKKAIQPSAPLIPEKKGGEPPPVLTIPKKGGTQPQTEDALIREMQFVHVPKGTFWMGWDSDKKESKQVTIDHFELAAYTVTQGQWAAVMGTNPSWFSRQGEGKDTVKGIPDPDLRRFAVENVSWNDVQAFLAKLNTLQAGKGWKYRLPTEAEWEYACRGGATSQEECSFDFYLAKPTNDLSSYQANFRGHAPAGTAAKGPFLVRPVVVGSYVPNKLGLYDMHGNVSQWCADLYSDVGPKRVVRGGSWNDFGRHCRAAYRGVVAPSIRDFTLGCRLARSVIVKGDKGSLAPASAPSSPPATEDELIAEMRFVRVPKGTFWMGWDSQKKLSKQVTIEQDFELAAYTVTQGQWQAVMGRNPSWFSRQAGGAKAVEGISDADLRHFPVERVSWDDVQAFLTKLNEREKGKGWTYRLPTEAEWEYACRGAAATKEECSFDFYLATPTNDLSVLQANFKGGLPAGDAAKGPDLGRTTKVGSYAPNKLGLHDMHGNVRVWCADLYSDLYPPTLKGRVIRGGSWLHSAVVSRTGFSLGYPASIRFSWLGCRLARVPSGG
jgi:formylglycine-generating enzyme required for sulfatase activity/tRNA A-37 threonylcarbamoyl transferase component Bud32